jgi:hypothetical protein
VGVGVGRSEEDQGLQTRKRKGRERKGREGRQSITKNENPPKSPQKQEIDASGHHTPV